MVCTELIASAAAIAAASAFACLAEVGAGAGAEGDGDGGGLLEAETTALVQRVYSCWHHDEHASQCDDRDMNTP